MQGKAAFISRPNRLRLLINIVIFGGWSIPTAYAACVTSGLTTTCNTDNPNPVTTMVGQGPSTPSGSSVNVQPDAKINVGNSNAISLGNDASIFLDNRASVTNRATSGAGSWSAGNNTVEFHSGGTLIVAEGAEIRALGTQNNAEAVNVIGDGNTIINHGVISGANSAAIWFEDRTRGRANIVDNYGVIQARNGSGNVIGNSGAGSVNFINRSGAEVRGNLTFASGNDSLTLHPGSVITGGFNGGGGTNSLFLTGEPGSADELPGTIQNFQSLIKTDEGRWTLSGSVGSNGGGTPLAVEVQGGTLALSGNNTNFNGSVRVDPTGTLEARAQSLPPSVTDNGLVLFNQPDNGAYGGVLSGTGSVTKIGTGTLALSGANSYQGGTLIQEGIVAVGADSALGGSTGGVTLDGGALRFISSFDLSADRTVTITGNDGTVIVDSGMTTTLNQEVGGAGALTKEGAGTLVLAGDNVYAGSTQVREGALYIYGEQSGAVGETTVQPGAVLGGTGTIGGDVIVMNNGTLSPGDVSGDPGTLTINRSLSLDSGSLLSYNFGQADVIGGPLNDLTVVKGDLVLDGTINVATTPGASFDPGIYRVISYDGALTNNGLDIGTIPSPSFYVQTSVAQQVNLINTASLNLNFWDGAAAANKDNNTVDGGDGIWQNSAGNDNWTESTGRLNAPYEDASFAIFMAAPGNVTVDNSLGQVRASGMQFASDGYRVQGDTIELVPDAATGGSVIRVGDGSSLGADYSVAMDAALAGDTQLVKTDLGTLVINGVNTYQRGTRIQGGIVAVGADNALGNDNGALTLDGGALRFSSSFDLSGNRVVTVTDNDGALIVDPGVTTTLTQAATGAGSLTKDGAGTLILTNDGNSWAGGTTIADGVLQVGDGGAAGDLPDATDVVNNGLLVFNRNNELALTGDISGSGGVVHQGPGTTELSGDNSYSGPTQVNSGALYIYGDQTAAVGDTTVASNATLGGAGTIGGNVAVMAGGALSPGHVSGDPGTLTINRNLSLDSASMLSYNFGQADVVGGPLNDLTIVKGDLVLDGRIDVSTTPGASFDPGIYRVISYDGALTDNGLDIGTIPSPDFYVQTSVARQVNLINTAGLTLNFWDGADPAHKNNNTVDGGDGLWQNSSGNDNWTDAAGTPNAPYADAAFAIFMAAPGDVTVDNGLGQVRASGMQFASDGYRVLGGAVELVPDADTGQSIIRVGDGGSQGADYTVNVDSVLTGNTKLIKTDLGTLALNGANTYQGGTQINGGTLQIAADAGLGAAGTGLGMNNGTLRTAQTFVLSRPIMLGDMGGGVEPMRDTVLTLASDIGGSGSLTKLGSGTAVVTGGNSYAGGTVIRTGTLQVGAGGTSGNIVGPVENDGVLAFDRSDRYVQSDAVSGSGQVVQRGRGYTVLNAVNSYAGGTTAAAGTLAVGDAGHADAALSGGGQVSVQMGATLGGYGSVTGNVVNAGTLAVADALPALGGGAGAFVINGGLINSGVADLAGAQPGNRLIVAGNYQGQSGTISLKTYLGGDGSPSDKLVVDGGTATGNTALRIANAGGRGEKTHGDGIQVVQALNGATTAPGAFASPDLYAGAYAYMLYRGGVTPGTQENWYLRSELVDTENDNKPTYRPGVPIYAEVSSVARELAVQQIGTFHERQGNQDLLVGNGRFPAGWARTWGDHFSERRDGTVNQSFSGNMFGFQVGQDLYARSGDNGRQHRVGVFAGYARADGDVRGFALGREGYGAGKLAIDSYSLGGYWTHVGSSGWYTDAVIMGSHLKVKPRSSAGDTASPRGKAFTASLEAGLPIPISNTTFTIEPQAQLIYQHTRIDSITDSASEVSFSPKNAFLGRIGARLQGEFQSGDITWKPYLRADLLHTFNGRDNVSFNDITTVDSAIGGTQARLGLGISGQLSERVSVYASGGYGFNLDGTRRETMQGNVGMRIRW